jgi:hypothetical protein
MFMRCASKKDARPHLLSDSICRSIGASSSRRTVGGRRNLAQHARGISCESGEFSAAKLGNDEVADADEVAALVLVLAVETAGVRRETLDEPRQLYPSDGAVVQIV